MNGYVAGFDGGGTKTEIACFSDSGAGLPGAFCGPLNINGASEAQIRQTISDGLAFLKSLPGGLEGCRCIVIGTAGVSNDTAAALITDAMHSNGYTGRLELLGDQEIALAGAVGDVGAVLIAGTGAICCGRNEKGEKIRTGGFGYLIDDEGSGYALGRDILSAYVRAQDGRIAPTCLTALVNEALHITDASGIVTYIYAPERSKRDTAVLAPLLLTALEQNDPAAADIARKAAEELALLALTALRRLDLTKAELALTGSIFTHYSLIRKQVIQLVAESMPGIACIAPKANAAIGAASIARKIAQDDLPPTHRP